MRTTALILFLAVAMSSTGQDLPDLGEPSHHRSSNRRTARVDTAVHINPFLNDVSGFSSSLSRLRNNISRRPAPPVSSISPYYFQLIEPSVYNAAATRRVMSLDGDTGTDYRDCLNTEIDHNLMNVYLGSPSKVRYSAARLAKEEVFVPAEQPKEDLVPAKPIDEILNEDLKTKSATEIDDHIDDKPNFWKCKGEFSLQFSQNYFSDNWYKGGNNNQNLLSALILQANYDDTKRLTWENKLEMRLGFMTTTSDTCHSFLTSNDKIDLTSKLGVKAHKSWFYTLSAEAKSQFMPGYKNNDRRKYSAFLAPLDVYVSVGMDFKPSLKNGNTFSLALLPFSYKMRYLGEDDANIHSVYNMPDEDYTHDIGSKIEMNCKLKLAKDFYWKSRLYYFTAYDYAEGEFENSFQYNFVAVRRQP